jgi:SAM-dependent methyltransferase
LKNAIKTHESFIEALQVLKGKKGLEIAGPSRIFRRKGSIPVYKYIGSLDDFSFPRPVERGGRNLSPGFTYNFLKFRKSGYQYIGDAVSLSQISNETYDFLIASHVLEHIANPLKALKEWIRVCKVGGYLLLVVPHKDFTFDHKRPVTSLEHFIQDFQKEVGEDDLTHVEEVLALTDISRDGAIQTLEDLKKRAENNPTNRCLHHHVFDIDSVVQLFDHMDIQVEAIAQKGLHIGILGRKPKF